VSLLVFILYENDGKSPLGSVRWFIWITIGP
jgi:hypothetical protein